MITLEKQPYKPFANFVESVLRVLKEQNEVKIEREMLNQFLNYLETKKIGKVEFTIIYSSNKKTVTLFNFQLEEYKRLNHIQKEIDFTNLTCYTNTCLFNTKHNFCMNQQKNTSCKFKAETNEN